MCTVFVCPPSSAAATDASHSNLLLPTSFVHSNYLELHPHVRASMTARARQRIDWVCRTAQPLLLPAKVPTASRRNQGNPHFAAPFSYLAIPLTNAKTSAVIGVLEVWFQRLLLLWSFVVTVVCNSTLSFLSPIAHSLSITPTFSPCDTCRCVGWHCLCIMR